jgi:hypothetical protein
MRRFLIGLLVMVALLAAVGVGAAMAVHWWGFTHDASLTIDGVTLDEAGIGAIVGVVAACVAMFVVVVVVAVVASVAVLVPLALIVGVGALVFALFVGLSPVLVPIVLIVGICVLVSRRSKRNAQRSVPTGPTASTIP